ncbi:MAG TPA: hypothetical protein V6C64_07480 [Microcoleaceae cyanobacterium]
MAIASDMSSDRDHLTVDNPVQQDSAVSRKGKGRNPANVLLFQEVQSL